MHVRWNIPRHSFTSSGLPVPATTFYCLDIEAMLCDSVLALHHSAGNSLLWQNLLLP
eukprot:m.408669 g.408669  ORF g.408669 m.408669 type:complete len:57 (+) comp21237_c0_seq18:209-379(+)